MNPISLTHIPYRTDTTVIGCSGFHGDCLTLTKIIEARLKVGLTTKPRKETGNCHYCIFWSDHVQSALTIWHRHVYMYQDMFYEQYDSSVMTFFPLQMYKHSNNKNMTSGAIAAMLSTILYGRRFFPYYVYNIIGGLDEEGEFVRDYGDGQRCFHMLK